MAAVDIGELEAKVRQMYRQVADQPDGPYHFEMGRALRPCARRGIADILTGRQLTEAILSNADLWAFCIGGAAQKDASLNLIEATGLTIKATRLNSFEFPVHPGPQRQHNMRGAKHQRTCGQTGPLSRNPPVNNRRETQ